MKKIIIILIINSLLPCVLISQTAAGMSNYISFDKKEDQGPEDKKPPPERDPEKIKQEVFFLDSEVDNRIPITRKKDSLAVAVVIGNSNYLEAKNVDYAINDATAIKRYLERSLGFSEGNIIFIEDAQKIDLERTFGIKGYHKGNLFNKVTAGKSEVFIFYSGHGAPGLNNKQGYFVPVDASPYQMELSGYPTQVFYENLGKLPAKNITIVLDACFSGVDPFDGISPSVIKSKGSYGIQKGTLLASSQSDQVSGWYKDKKHGFFTYSFLKAIHNKNADADGDGHLTINEIYRFITDKNNHFSVPFLARTQNLEQSPAIHSRGDNTNRVLVKY